METQRMSRICHFISYHIVLHITFLSIHDIAAAMRRHTANLWFLNEGMWRGEASLSWKNMVALVCKVIFLAFSPYFGHSNKVLLVSWKGLVEMVFILQSSSRTKKTTTQTKTPWQWSCSQPFLPHQAWQKLNLLMQLTNAVVPNWYTTLIWVAIANGKINFCNLQAQRRWVRFRINVNLQFLSWPW